MQSAEHWSILYQELHSVKEVAWGILVPRVLVVKRRLREAKLFV